MTPQELEKELTELPTKIYKFNEEAIGARENYQKLEADYDNELSKAFLKAKAEAPEKSIKELEFFAESQCLLKRYDVIKAEAVWHKARNLADSAERKFSGLQSVVKLVSSEIRASLSGN